MELLHVTEQLESGFRVQDPSSLLTNGLPMGLRPVYLGAHSRQSTGMSSGQTALSALLVEAQEDPETEPQESEDPSGSTSSHLLHASASGRVLSAHVELCAIG
jgi:hypothetical protein